MSTYLPTYLLTGASCGVDNNPCEERGGRTEDGLPSKVILCPLPAAAAAASTRFEVGIEEGGGAC